MKFEEQHPQLHAREIDSVFEGEGKMNLYRVWTAMFSLAGVVLCGDAMAVGQNTTSPSAADKKFVQGALEGGAVEIKLGQLAVKKGSSEDVKEFGQKMIDDHGKMDGQMRDLAQKEGIKTHVKTNDKDKALEKKLNSLSGAPFDKTYIAATVRDHRHVMAGFTREANAGNDTAIKDAASQGLPLINEHLKLAEQLAHNHHVTVSEKSK